MMKRYVIALMLLLFANPAIAGETIKHYNNQHNIIGYTIIENGRESHFDRAWNRIGKTNEHGIIFDADQSRTGYIKWDGDTGYVFDRHGNRTGYIKKQNGKETFYNIDWKREGYKK